MCGPLLSGQPTMRVCTASTDAEKWYGVSEIGSDPDPDKLIITLSRRGAKRCDQEQPRGIVFHRCRGLPEAMRRSSGENGHGSAG